MRGGATDPKDNLGVQKFGKELHFPRAIHVEFNKVKFGARWEEDKSSCVQGGKQKGAQPLSETVAIEMNTQNVERHAKGTISFVTSLYPIFFLEQRID